MKNIYIIHPKAFNVGNDMIFIAVRAFLRNAFKNEDINIISLPATSKYESHKKAGLSSGTIYEINRFGNGLIVGGGNLYENGELEVNHIALKALDKPTMIVSVSRGKVYNNELELVDRTDVMTDQNIFLLNEKADISLSRDIATKAHIDNLGADNLLGGCPTLFINEMPQHVVPLSDSNKTDALISVRTPTLMSIPVEHQYKVRDQILSMIEVLKEKGYKKIKLLCHDHRDIPFAASFSGVEYLFSSDVYTFLSYLRNTRLNVTFRLHSFLPCVSIGTPAIKISYDQRALSMLETVGLDSWNINLLKDDLMKEFEDRLTNLSELDVLKAKLEKTLWPKIKKGFEDNFAKFADLVNNKG